MQGLHRDKHMPSDVSYATRQVEMDDNVAAVGAGGALAVVVASDVFNVSGCAFSGNSAKTDGGALSLTSFAANATTTIARTDFQVTRQTEISSAVLREEALREQGSVSSRTCTTHADRLEWLQQPTVLLNQARLLRRAAPSPQRVILPCSHRATRQQSWEEPWLPRHRPGCC